MCGICGESTDSTPAVDKIDRDLAQIYHAKRKREGLYVHLAAWSGILLATALSILMILLLPGWTKVFAIIFLVLGGYFAGVFFGNVLIQGFCLSGGSEDVRQALDAVAGSQTSGGVIEA